MENSSGPHISPSHQPGINPRTTPINADTEIKDLQLVTKSSVQQDPDLSQKLWNDAYDRIEKEEDKLVMAYVEALTRFLDPSAAGASDVLSHKDPKAEKTTNASNAKTIDISVELQDRTKRQMYMEKLLENGQAKIRKASKMTKIVGAVAETVLSVKPVIDLAIQNIPQAAPAALPWAGVCVGLQVHNYQFHAWFPGQLIFIRYYRIQRKRRDRTLRVSLMLLPEWSGIAP
jgi:hypothetical protein